MNIEGIGVGGPIFADEFDPDHQAQPAHVADRAMGFVQLGESVEGVLGEFGNVRHDIVERFDGGRSGGTADRVAPERGAV